MKRFAQLDGTAALELPQDKRLALFVYLAVKGRSGPVRRENVLGVFWPDRPEARARNLLSQSLCHLRKAVGPGLVRTSGARDVWLDPGRIRCDAVAFEEQLDRGDTEAALAHYQGPFLDGFLPRGIREFLGWIDLERHRLLRLATEGAKQLSLRAARDGGDLDTAVRWARWTRRHMPFDETTLRRLLELLASSGRRVEALREYRHFEERLGRELELEPDPRTRALVGSIRTGEAVTSIAPA